MKKNDTSKERLSLLETKWIDDIYQNVFGNRNCETVFEDLKRDGVCVLDDLFNTEKVVAIVTEIRKAVLGLGVDKIPTKVRGIIKLGLGFANETIFWYLRIVLNTFFEEFLGSKLTLTSFDTMNETTDKSPITANPHVDVLFGSEKTDSLQCIFQFKIRISNNGTLPSDFQVIDGDDANGAGFNFYKGSHDPVVRYRLMKRFPEQIVKGTWELPKENIDEIVQFLENDCACKHTIVAKNNCLIIFDGATIHNAGKNFKPTKDENVVRYAVYASVQRLAEVPYWDIDKRIKWLYLSETKRGTGHQILNPNVQTARTYEQDAETIRHLQINYIPKMCLDRSRDKSRVVMTPMKDDHQMSNIALKLFDFERFGIRNKATFEDKVNHLSGVDCWSIGPRHLKKIVESEAIDQLFACNYLLKYNTFKKERLATYFSENNIETPSSIIVIPQKALTMAATASKTVTPVSRKRKEQHSTDKDINTNIKKILISK